jgi:A/G-specific adenine glycosylase
MEKGGEKWIRSLIRESLPKGRARDRYNALMDYGALELTARKSGIAPSTKQSKFSWSTRQVRAWIIRTILESPAWCITRNAVEKLYEERDDIDQIISKMIQEKLIQEDNYGFSIT